MRLRVQTIPPLPELKAWFIPDIQAAFPTINDLKLSFCASIPTLRNANLAGSDLTLHLDGFDLLGESPLDVVRDGDLIQLRQARPRSENVDSATHSSRDQAIGRKRKRSPGRSSATDSSWPAQILSKPVPTKADSSSSSETTSESETEASDSSEDSTSDSSDSESDSSSTPSSKPVVLPIARSLAAINNPVQKKERPSKSPVFTPPGHGSASTRRRNKRRRIRRRFQKERQEIAPVPEMSATNSTPLGLRQNALAVEPVASTSSQTLDPIITPPIVTRLSVASLTPPVPTWPKKQAPSRSRSGPAFDVATALNSAFNSNSKTGALRPGTQMDVVDDTELENIPERQLVTSQPREVMMASLGNKNKRKGYKNRLTTQFPSKIIFEGAPKNNEQAAAPDKVVNGARSIQPVVSIGYNVRLVPPSERQELGGLPPNIFVTSVDVEENISRGKKNKKKAQPRQAHEKEKPELVQYEDVAEGDISLDYGDELQSAELTAAQDPPLQATKLFEWNRAEGEWDQYQVVEGVDQLIVGEMFGWKGLAMNPDTFSPEFLMIVARIYQIEGVGDDTRVVIRQLLRPRSSAIGFSSTKLRSALDEELTGQEPGQEEGEEEEFGWKDILDAGWRRIGRAVTLS